MFWKYAAKQMTPAPPMTVARTMGAMVLLLKTSPSKVGYETMGVAGASGARAGRARAEIGS